jgi:hypothetical protein
MLLPDDGIAVAVMTNTSSSLMAPIVAYRVLDQRLDLEPLDWFSSYKPWYDTLQAGMREARGERRVVPDAPLPRPLEACAGEYEHPRFLSGSAAPTQWARSRSWSPCGVTRC